jgi:uroporphyrin-3 C-methyltransferase
LLLAGVDWYRLRTSQTQQTALEQRLAALQESAAPKDTLAAQDAAAQQALKGLGMRLDDLDSAYTELRKHSEEGRDAWIKAEAAALLVAANEEVAIRADPALALKALQQADERLKLISDPRLIAVRQEIARESIALRAVPQPDIEGMAVALIGVAGSVDSLPMKRSVPEHYRSGGDLSTDVTSADTGGLWARFKAAVARLGADMFTVRRHDLPVEPLLAPREEFLLRRNLELRLESTRSALLGHEGRAFSDSARAAQIWLQDYFDTRDKVVAAAVQQLQAMQQQDIAPRLPDLSASLLLLRQLETPRNAAP